MSYLHSSIASRSIAGVLLLLLLVFMWQFLARPVSAWLTGFEATMVEEETRYLRFAEMASRRPALESQLDILQAVDGGGRFLLTALDRQDAQTELQALLRRIITESGGQLVTIGGAEAEANDMSGLQGVAAQVQVNCNVAQLGLVLVAIERSLPLLEIDHISVRAQSETRSDRDNRIRIQMLVSALLVEEVAE